MEPVQTPPRAAPLDPAKARKTALICGGVVVGMTALAFASVPLYDLFCKVTGFGGTPMVREANTSKPIDRVMNVRFDANVAPGLGWVFQAESAVIKARVGETQTVFYKVTNKSDKPTTGIATFNVTPAQAGAHFVKIQCFCFTEHTLAPGESMDAPVVFYVDPEIEQNAELKGLKSMTLSYTYFPAKNGQPVAGLQGAGDKPKL
ncbi:MAG: cytochrome c oxidase assembly protein [Bosea sp. (in: a-proteobacteria)]